MCAHVWNKMKTTIGPTCVASMDDTMRCNSSELPMAMLGNCKQDNKLLWCHTYWHDTGAHTKHTHTAKSEIQNISSTMNMNN